MSFKYLRLIAIAAAMLFAGSASAVTYTDNFSGNASTLSWNALNYACLTAGTGASGAAGVIPACSPAFDANGSGALRLTPAAGNQAGAILSNFAPFPLTQGLQVTFTTYTYGGNSGGTAGNGADGITFFLTDGTQAVPTVAGGLGGSLGYSCSNTNSQYEGLANAYLGLGIDEYGNFLNNADNTNTGIENTNYSGITTNGTNTYTNGQDQYQPERIGLRGAGNLTWTWLNAKNPTYYSGNVDITKTKAACSSGQYVSGTITTTTGFGRNKVTTTTNTYANIPYNYNAIAGGYAVLPNNTKIANESATTRAQATPITYKLQISASGLLNFAYSYNNGVFQPVLVNNSITSTNGPLPASLRFGFSSGTGGSWNIHEITCFQASPLQSNTSAGANTVQSGQFNAGAAVYLATYTSDNWWGSVTSNSVLAASDGSLSVSSVANWDANCDITGGSCASLGLDSSGKTKTVTAQTSRNLLTWNGSAGVAFQWANLTTAQATNLNGTDGAGSTRVSWLRGDRSTEQLYSPVPGTLRARNQVLGDIIDSSPTFVAAPAANTYPDAFTDSLVGTSATKPENASGAQTYSAFVTANAGRQNIVYAGSNDGFLHAFAAGPASANGTYNASTNNGSELLGFMPAGLLANSTNSTNLVNLTSPNYVHNYYVDATPVAGDLFYGSKWHTWLVGGVGSGGSEIYALDITDPTQFTEATASSVVMGDWTSATAGLSNLGQTVGTPVITRLHNGNWAIIFGNGLGSGKAAGIYIGLVNSTSGAVTFTFYSTGVGSASVPNGIAYVATADLDGDQITDYIYAGDQQGNLWRLDVTSNTASNWSYSKFGNTTATPLYVAKSGASTPLLQPITTAPVVASVTVGGGNRVMVMFGTGQKTPFNSTSGDVYATGSQTFYGIWDWDMSAWNAAAIANAQYASLTGKQTVNRSVLLQQTLASTSTGSGTNSQVLGYRYLNVGTVVCWQGSSACSSNNNQYGWLFDLPTTNEQIIYSPTLIGGAVTVNTAIPPTVSASTCNAGLQSGWTMSFDPASGGGIVQSFFPNPDGSTGTVNGSTVGGIQLNGVGSPSSISYNGQTYLVSQTVNGTPALSKVYPPNGAKSRVSWKEIRY
ncbi:PilC/PilY family type IV pilus protein [Rhodanobacter sp. BL-MT-08]